MRSTTLIPLLMLACNTAPGALQITLGPAEPHTTTDLVAELSGDFTDPDGDEVTYSFTWYQDEQARPDLTELTVPASETTKGETWKIFVLPTDGRADGPPSEAEILVLNTAPVVETVTLEPTVPLTTEDVVATVTVDDEDGDTVTLAYSWHLGEGATGYQEATLPASATTRGDVWTLHITPSDDEESGDEVLASVNIDNTAPAVVSVSLAPQDPREGDTIIASAITEDEDGDTVSLLYRWFADDALVLEGEHPSLSDAYFAKDQQISVEVTPNDGFIDGEALTSAPVTVRNSTPSVDGATVEPQEIYEASELSCAGQGWSDPDGDPEGYSVTWYVNGAELGSEETLDGASFDRGDNVSCALVPDDGGDQGEAVLSVPVAVLNTAPVIAGASISPSAPMEGDTVTVSVTGTDVDGDAVLLSYAWSVDGSQVSTAVSIDSSLFDKHQSIQVEVTPSDDADTGVSLVSGTVTSANSPPEITSLVLTPVELYTGDTVSAHAAATDADGDEVSLSYAWSVDGTALGVTDSTLDGDTHFDKHQTVTVSVTANDGEDDGSVAVVSATVLNTPPGAPTVSVAPERPEDQVDALVCSYLEDAADADADTISYDLTWLENGAAYAGAAETTLVAGDTIAASDIHGDHSYTCQVTPHDGDEAGEIGTAGTTAGWYYNGWDSWEVALAGADHAFLGENEDDIAGIAVANAGDFDGDGLEDLVIGATGYDDSYSDDGRVYVFLASSLGTDTALDLDDADHVLRGESCDSSAPNSAGHRLDASGDFDQDGIADLVVGAGRGCAETGLIYVTFGSTLMSAGDVDLMGESDATIFSASQPNSTALSTIGDIDGDGVPELLSTHVDSSGEASIILGSTIASGWSINIEDAEYHFEGSYNDYYGRAASSGDLDGDGLADLALGESDNVYEDGRVRYYLATSLAIPGSYANTDADGDIGSDNPCESWGCGVRLGYALSIEEDLDGDGYADVLTGMPGDDNGGTDAGGVLLFSGADLLTAVGLEVGDAITTLYGEEEGDGTGSRISRGGTIDDDETMDFLVSGIQEYTGGAYRGKTYLLLASTLVSGGSSTLAEADFLFTGEDDGDRAGQAISAAGDVNGDGLSDILIGAPYSDDAGTNAGKAYLLFTP